MSSGDCRKMLFLFLILFRNTVLLLFHDSGSVDEIIFWLISKHLITLITSSLIEQSISRPTFLIFCH